MPKTATKKSSKKKVAAKPATKTAMKPSAKSAPKKHPMFAYQIAKIYPLYVQKVERKGRTKRELDQVLCWLTGYDAKGLKKQMEGTNDLETFFAQAPKMNPKCKLITGVVCGIRVEDIPDPLMRKVRYMDKVVDELAQGKAMERILRQ